MALLCYGKPWMFFPFIQRFSTSRRLSQARPQLFPQHYVKSRTPKVHNCCASPPLPPLTRFVVARAQNGCSARTVPYVMLFLVTLVKHRHRLTDACNRIPRIEHKTAKKPFSVPLFSLPDRIRSTVYRRAMDKKGANAPSKAFRLAAGESIILTRLVKTIPENMVVL